MYQGTVLLTLLFLCSLSQAVVYNYYPSTPNFATDLLGKTLHGGDIVYFHASSPGGTATYDFAAVGSTYNWVGSQTNPIIVQSYPGDKIIFTTSNNNHNCLQLSGQYWVLQGFEFVGNSAAQGALPLRLMAGTNNVVLQNMKLHDLYENAITANIPGADYSNITFRGLEIWKTAGTGECIYAGCQGTNSTYTPCQIHDSLFENNYCHDTCLGGGNTQCTGGSMGSGFQVKFGSYKNIIRNNVCYNVNSPCVLIYDDFDKGANLVEGNFIVNTRSDSGIQVAAGAIIRNNIIINSAASGITITSNPLDLYNNQGNRNLNIIHNTFVSNLKYGIEFQATPSRTNVSNNAVLGNVRGDFSSTSQVGVTWNNNAYNSGQPPAGVSSTGAFAVGPTNNELVSPTTFNVYPQSSSHLINAGYRGQLLYDFNYKSRSGCTPTVGAYEYTQNNPGWIPPNPPGFKMITGSVAPCNLSNPCTSTC